MIKRLFFFLSFLVGLPILICAQNIDSVLLQKDSLQNPLPVAVNGYSASQKALLKQNVFLNSSATPVAMAVKLKKSKSTDAVFYLLAGLILLMAIIKYFYSRYFNTLFRVFFNTSLRQGQLTDQLLQAKLPSLFFNLFFILSGGTYIYFLLLHYGFLNNQHIGVLIFSCIAILGLVYFVKFSTLKFTGWVTGYKEATDTYIFIIFLICKIIGILLIPFIVLMAFSNLPIASTSAILSLLLIVFLLLLRFFRSYGLLQNQLKVSKFHFFLYIAGLEIMPLLLVYKGLVILLSKNL